MNTQPTDAETLRALQFALAPLEDLRHESLMADESEYGPRCNLPDDEGWRNV